MRKIRLALLLALILMSSGLAAQAEDGIPDNCEYKDAAYYQPNIFPRYERNNRRLLLVDWNTGKITKELETSLELSLFRVWSWSPNCRYLAATTTYGVGVWDVTTGKRLQVFDTVEEWSPDSNYALVYSWRTSSIYLWNILSGNLIALRKTYPNAYQRVYWDMPRYQFLTISRYYPDGWQVVIAYDISSGHEIARFTNPGRLGPLNFIVSSDDSKIVVFTDESAKWSSHKGIQSGVTIWDRDSLTHTQINVDHYAASSRNQIALSQDNRYLVIGDDALRVWDIQHLPERVEDRIPIYRHGGPKARIWSVRFSDWGVIETTSEEGVQHWDLHTGEYIPAS